MTARCIETPAANVILSEDGVLRVIVHPGAEVGADEIRAFLAARMELAPFEVPVLIDQRRIRSMTREAQVVSTQGARDRPTLCLAILMEGPLAVMIANFFVIFGRPHYPTRLFTTEEAALAWIAEQRAARAGAHV
jgi:hypothetical protein